MLYVRYFLVLYEAAGAQFAQVVWVFRNPSVTRHVHAPGSSSSSMLAVVVAAANSGSKMTCEIAAGVGRAQLLLIHSHPVHARRVQASCLDLRNPRPSSSGGVAAPPWSPRRALPWTPKVKARRRLGTTGVYCRSRLYCENEVPSTQSKSKLLCSSYENSDTPSSRLL